MKKKILVVDDEAGLLKAILIRLNNLGYEAFGGVDGQEALALVRERVPDLIILDVSLPKVDGDEIAALLKKNEKLKHIPVILISAMAETLRKRARKIGAASYFSKPLEMEELLGWIEKNLPLTKIDPLTKKILVIDDDAADRKNMVTAMEGEGYAVMEASDADEAMRKAGQTRPDLVIVDVVTQDSNTTGFDVCRQIRTTFQPNPPAVLIVTGKGEGVSHSLADRMGAAGFEIKTRDMAHVVRAVRKIFVDEANAAGVETESSSRVHEAKVDPNILAVKADASGSEARTSFMSRMIKTVRKIFSRSGG